MLTHFCCHSLRSLNLTNELQVIRYNQLGARRRGTVNYQDSSKLDKAGTGLSMKLNVDFRTEYCWRKENKEM